MGLQKLPGMEVRMQKWGKGSRGSFAESADKLEAWILAHGGALPKRTGDKEEKSLAQFLNKQCFPSSTQGSRAVLTEEKRQRLQRIPGLDKRLLRWNIARTRPFSERVSELKAWVLAHDDQLPKRHGGDAESQGLAKFLSVHQQDHRN